MSAFQKALQFQNLLEQVGERVKDSPQGRSYLSPDGCAYVLALGGEHAKVMDDFITAVGEYLMKIQKPKADKDAAREEIHRAFEEWLSKQKLF